MPQAAVSALRELFAHRTYPFPLEFRALSETRRPRLGRFSIKSDADWGRVGDWLERVDVKPTKGVYVVMNPFEPKEGTSVLDDAVTRREWLLVDIDADREAGTSATEAERKAALVTMKKVRRWLVDQGWPEPFVAASGNGGHLMWRLDLDTSEAVTEAVQAVLGVLSLKFDNKGAKVDRTVFNLSRIWRVPGTWARKGQDTEERPWRQAKLAKVGAAEKVTFEQLAGIATRLDEGKSEETAEIAKVQTWLHKHYKLGAPRTYSGRTGRGVRWIFPKCPWDPAHTDRSAYLIRFESGNLAAGCLHQSCPGNGAGWKGLQEISPEPIKGLINRSALGPSTAAAPGLTDLGNAKRLVNLYGDSLHFVPEWGKWLEFDGCRWQGDNTGLIMQRSAAAVATLFAQADTEPDEKRAKKMKAFAVRSESVGALTAMEKLARAEPGVSIPVAELDTDPWVLNCQNGVLDLKSGKLLPADRKRMLTKVSPVGYFSDRKCPTWDAFLDRIFAGDQDLIAFIHRALGYCLTGSVREQVLFFCHGIGANGKTTFLRTMQHLLGDYGIQTDAALLMASKGERHPTGLADLHKVRFAAASETDRGRQFSEALVKQITGDDIMVARRMRQDFFRFEPTHKLWLAANYKPIIKGNDVGIWRRILYIPFEVIIPQGERDKELPEKLRAEAPGILARIVEGCVAWQKQGLAPPAKVVDKTSEYKEEMDLLREFFEECCRMGSEHRVTRAQLYEAYRDWSEGRYDRPLKFTYFNRLVAERGLVLRDVDTGAGTTVKYWEGLTLGTRQRGQVIELDY